MSIEQKQSYSDAVKGLSNKQGHEHIKGIIDKVMRGDGKSSDKLNHVKNVIHGYHNNTGESIHYGPNEPGYHLATSIDHPGIVGHYNEGVEYYEDNLLEKYSNDPVVKFASAAHEVWRKGFDPEGTGKERIKKNSDGTEGNINVPFDKLHPDWQKENLAAGKAALEAIKKFPNNHHAAAEHIHKEWMKRNPKQDWNASQHVPYWSLSKDERDKDMDQVKTIRNIVKGNQMEEEYQLLESARFSRIWLRHTIPGKIGIAGKTVDGKLVNISSHSDRGKTAENKAKELADKHGLSATDDSGWSYSSKTNESVEFVNSIISGNLVESKDKFNSIIFSKIADLTEELKQAIGEEYFGEEKEDEDDIKSSEVSDTEEQLHPHMQLKKIASYTPYADEGDLTDSGAINKNSKPFKTTLPKFKHINGEESDIHPKVAGLLTDIFEKGGLKADDHKELLNRIHSSKDGYKQALHDIVSGKVKLNKSVYGGDARTNESILEELFTI